MPTLTVTLPADLAATVDEAVRDGDYASASDVVREALRVWQARREQRRREFAALQADIKRGIAAIGDGDFEDFDPRRIIGQAKASSGGRFRSA